MADGFKTAVELATAAAEDDAEGDRLEQLDLLGLPTPAGLEADRLEVIRGRGRPAGSRNKRTLATLAYLQTRYHSPLEGLAQLYSTSVAELALRVGCSPLEALQEIRQALVAALPYWHQRQAIAVDVTRHDEVHLHIHTGAGELAELGGITEAEIIENEENQSVSEGVKSDV